jgi:hypothetical protein
LYVAGGAALGLVAFGAARQRRLRLAHVAESEGAERNRLAGDVSDVPTPVQEALAASARVHGLTHPLSEELTHDIFGRAAERRPTPGNERHELSSLIGPGAIAPDEASAGEELADPGAVEVPIGQSAEPDIDRELSHSKLLQPDSSGAALFTAQPTAEAPALDEAYDAVAPDDLGAEWLTRATQGSSLGTDSDALETDLARDAGLSVMSQGSLEAASAEELEAIAASELEAVSEEDLVDLDEALDEEDTVVSEATQTLPGRSPAPGRGQ